MPSVSFCVLRVRPSFRREKKPSAIRLPPPAEYASATPTTRAAISRPGAAAVASRTGGEMLGMAGVRALGQQRHRPPELCRQEALRAPPCPPRAAAPPVRAAPRPAPRASAPPACRAVRCRETRAGTAVRPAATKSSVSRNSASVSVGKPAIRSAPIAMPGRSARARAIAAAASARRWRRFMRFRIRSLPACSDRCRCGISRGSSPSSRQSPSSIAAGSSDESRSRRSSGTSASSRRTSWPSRGAPGRSAP